MDSTISIVVTLCFFFIDRSHCLGFSTRLIPRDSPLSPFCNPNATIEDRAKAALARSDARIRYYESLQSVNGSLRAAMGPLTPAGGEYLMKFSVGTPPQEMMGIIDTGSDLTWFQCLPCIRCFRMRLPVWDPQKSTTYKRVHCWELHCGEQLISTCDDKSGFCGYQIKYSDGSISSGDIATDTFVFKLSNDPTGRPVAVNGVMFGCGHVNSISVSYEETGIVGLNKGPFSLINTMNLTGFSHCFKELDDPDDHDGGFLMLGDDAIITGISTPFAKVNNREEFYYVNLEAISVGILKLPIPVEVFRPDSDGRGGVMTDTGAQFTFLPKIAVDQVVGEMREQFKYCGEVPDPNGRFALCYGCTILDLDHAPNIVFHFPGANVALSKTGAFYRVSKYLWCLAMLYTKGSHSIIGNHALQGYNIGYDLKEGLMSFDLMDCSLADRLTGLKE